ncbi:MAG: outer membrane protein assembly factor BamA [Ignavibacteriaceae bacterium]
MLKYFFSILLLFSITSAFAQNARTSYKILGVTVEGNRTADANTITNSSGLKIGDEIQIPGDQTINAIRNLYSLNIFSDIKIELDKEVQGGAFLIIRVKEFPRIQKVVVEGNDEIDTDDIEAKINFTPGQALKQQEVARLKQRILDLYEEEGFLNAQVDTKTYDFYRADTLDEIIAVTWRNSKDLSDEYNTEYEIGTETYTNFSERLKERVIVKLIVEENEQVVVRKIMFTGNQAFDDDDLKGEMDETAESKWWKFWSSAQFEPVKYEEDKGLILKHYLRNGYRDAEIISDTLIYSGNKEDLTIQINVFEGPQYKIRNIEWEGNTVYPDNFLTEQLEFSRGDIYNYEKFEQNLRGNERQTDISSLYLDNGYLTFNIRPTEVRVGEDSIDVFIRVEEKNQFRIGKVGITGNDKTKDKVIRRELYTIPGDYFNRALMIRSVQQLANLQYFNVEKLYGPSGTDIQLENDSTVNVTFAVEEKSSDYLNASVGYSEAFGFSGAVGVTLTNFSITEPFSLGGGQVLSFNWQFGVGSLYRTFSVGFTEPWMWDTPTLLGVELFDTRQRYYYDLRQSGATLRVGRRLKWPDDYFYVQGMLRYQYNDIKEGGAYYREGKYQQYTLGSTISRRDIDNPIFPSQGSSVTLNAEISGGPFLPGEVEYWKMGFKAEWYKRMFGTNRVTLYTSADFGYLDELVAGTPINPFEKFFMGGNGLVIATVPLRGYDDRSIGPLDPFTGDAVGGNVMAKFTTELRFAVAIEPIPIYMLAFAEAGNIYESFGKADFFDLRRAVGVGARIMINPIGLIGFDVGYGFDRKLVTGSDPKWLFHFQFGKGF